MAYRPIKLAIQSADDGIYGSSEMFEPFEGMYSLKFGDNTVEPIQTIPQYIRDLT